MQCNKQTTSLGYFLQPVFSQDIFCGASGPGASFCYKKSHQFNNHFLGKNKKLHINYLLFNVLVTIVNRYIKLYNILSFVY